MARRGWDKRRLCGVRFWRMQGTGLGHCCGQLCSAGTTKSRRERGPCWGQALPELWEHPWGAAGATSTWRKGLTVPCRAFQVHPTWKSCSDAAPTPWGPCRAVWDTQRAHGMTSDKGWCHVCHELTPQQHQVWSVLCPPRCCWGHPDPVYIFPNSWHFLTQLHPPKSSVSLSSPTIPWAPQSSGAGCNPEGSERVQHHQ